MNDNGEGFLTSYGELADLLERLPVTLREARRMRRVGAGTAAAQMGVSKSTLMRLEGYAGERATGERLSGASLDSVLAALRWLDGSDPGEAAEASVAGAEG